MVTSELLVAFIGTLLFKSATSAAINYEPIKITVNENFNAQPGQVSTELQALEPGVLHQGANFYFKPQLTLPKSFIPSHIEALISLIQQHHHSCAKDASKVVVKKDKLIEILQPFMYAESEISKETLSDILEKEIINYVEPKLKTSELVNIPEAPILPSLSFKSNPPNVEEEIKKEKTVIVERQKGRFPTIPEIAMRPIHDVKPEPTSSELLVIPEAPVLPTLSTYDSKLIEDGVKFNKPIIFDVELKPTIQEHLDIPEDPVLTHLAIHDIPSIVKEDVKKEESIIFEEATGGFSTIPEIAVRPIQEPIMNYVEPKLMTSEFVNIPEAPILPSLSYKGFPPNIEEEIKKEETVILNEQRGVFPTIPKITWRPIKEAIINNVEPKPINPELEDIPEAPVLPPLSANNIKLIEDGVKINEPIVVDVESKPVIQEYVVIPQGAILPPLILPDIPSLVEDEVKKEESIIFKESTEVFSTIPEIAVRPIQEPIMNYVEPKLMTSELVNIPEAPALPSLSYKGFPPNIEEEIKKEETVILNEQRGVFPTIPKITWRPIKEAIINNVEPKPINPELEDIPEAPVLPPLSANNIKLLEDGVKINEPIVVDVESKPVIQEYVVIPQAPILPPLTLHDIPSLVEEEVKKEESIIFKEPTEVFSTIPEIAVRPIQEPIINYVEPEPTTSDFLVIPEAPVLPPLSANDIHVVEKVKIEDPVIVDVEPKPVIQEFVIPEAPILPPLSLKSIPSFFEEKVKKEESIIFDVPIGVLPTIPHIAERPIKEPINYVESKLVTSEHVNIPEAPFLSSLSFNGISTNVEEEIKSEESILVEGQRGVFPTIPYIAERPIQESIIDFVEAKPITEFQVIPEAPVLPLLSANDLRLIKDGLKIEESAIVNVESKPATQELALIPEAPVLPPLSRHDFPSFMEEVKKEESVIFEKSKGWSSTIPKASVAPIPEPIINYDEPKSASKFGIIPEAPILPPLSAKDIHVFEEEVKIEEPIVIEEPTPFISNDIVIPEAPVIPDLSINGIPTIGDEVTIEKSEKVEESTGVLPSIPDIFARPIQEPIVVSETAKSLALENKVFPVATEEVKIEIPILLEETIELFPPIAEISSGLSQETIQEPEMTNSFVLEEVSQPNPENVVKIKETLPPTIIPKPSNNLGVFSYAPFVSHLSNRAPKTNKLTIAKPASLERFLLKKHPFRLPVTPFPKLSLNEMKAPIWGNKKQFLYPTSYAHDVVEKRIAPNMAFKKNAPPKRVKIYIRSQVPKGPSYL